MDYEDWIEETPVRDMLSSDEIELVLFWFKHKDHEKAMTELNRFMWNAWERYQEDYGNDY